MAAGTAAFNDFGGHIHGSAGHGALLAATSGIVDSKGSTLAGDELSCTKIDKFDDTIVIEKDICKSQLGQ